MQVTLGWNEPPGSAVALGGIFRWKDGRDMPDLHTVLFDYHGIPVYVRLGLSTETPEQARFMGPHGILDAGEFGIACTYQTGKDSAPSYYDVGFPQPMRGQYEHDWHEKNDPPIGQERISQRVVYSGDDWDDYRPHLWNFFQAVKTRQPVVEDAVFGNHTAIACHMANESYFLKRQVFFDPATRTLKS